jgi:2'-5' RNA ligase
MRCFIALPLPAVARTELGQTAEELAGHYPDLAWVSPENYHLTLAFLGEQGPAGLACAKTALRSLAGIRAPILVPRAISVFPPRGPWRVLVVELDSAVRQNPLEVPAGDGSSSDTCVNRENQNLLPHPKGGEDSLSLLHERLNNRLAEEAEQAGLAPLNADWSSDSRRPSKRFRAHITLARRRSGSSSGLDTLGTAVLAEAYRGLAQKTSEGGWPIEACLLYKSELRRQAVVYNEIDRVALIHL